MPTPAKPNEVTILDSAPQAQRLLSESEAEAVLEQAYGASAKQDVKMARKFQATDDDGLGVKHRK